MYWGYKNCLILKMSSVFTFCSVSYHSNPNPIHLCNKRNYEITRILHRTRKKILSKKKNHSNKKNLGLKIMLFAKTKMNSVPEKSKKCSFARIAHTPYTNNFFFPGITQYICVFTHVEQWMPSPELIFQLTFT